VFLHVGVRAAWRYMPTFRLNVLFSPFRVITMTIHKVFEKRTHVLDSFSFLLHGLLQRQRPMFVLRRWLRQGWDHAAAFSTSRILIIAFSTLPVKYSYYSFLNVTIMVQ